MLLTRSFLSRFLGATSSFGRGVGWFKLIRGVLGIKALIFGLEKTRYDDSMYNMSCFTSGPVIVSDSLYLTAVGCISTMKMPFHCL
ncbi:hypothetical protein OIU78_006829 [Salix suchowensis]|nr:hypothetical protein OIU78_006829 [Salix suchowensis]